MRQPLTAAVRFLSGEREPVRVATTGNLSNIYGLLVIDDVELEVGDRVLVKDQTDAKFNGIYLSSVGKWFRAPDASYSRAIDEGVTVAVQEGTANNGKTFRFSSKSPRVGTDPITLTYFLSDTIGQDIIEDAVGAVQPLVVSAQSAADRAEAAAVGLELMPVHPETFGAKHDGSNDKAAIEAAAVFAVAQNRPLELTTGRTYTISSLALGALVGLTIIGEGSLRHDGSVVSGDIASFGENTVARQLKLSLPGHGNGIYDLRLGARSKVEYVEIAADTQSQGESLVTMGQDVQIGYFRARNLDRPLHVDNSSGAGLTSGFTLLGYDATSYMRFARLTATRNYSIGVGNVRGRSPNALNESPGYNVWLLTSAPGGTIAGGVWEDSGEHTVRVGGNIGPGSVNTTDVSFGDLIIKRCSASPIKINPNYNNRARNISFGDITVVDGGFTTGSTAKRSDGLRLSHFDNVTVRSIRFLTEQLATSCEVAIRINNGTNLRVGFIDSRFVESGLLAFDETADIDTGQAATQSGPATGVYVDRWIGTKGTGNYPVSIAMPSQTVSHIRISGIRWDSFTTGFIAFAVGQSLGGIIEFKGTITGAGALTFSNLPDVDNLRLDLVVDGVRMIGPARNMAKIPATMVISGDPFDLSNGASQLGALDIMTLKGSGGVGNFGAGVAFHGAAASGRRRAAIAPRQMGAADHNVGLSFLVNAGVGGSDQLVEVFGLKPGGGVRGGLPTFATNAAAVTGGLAVGDWYKTSTGELRIVV